MPGMGKGNKMDKPESRPSIVNPNLIETTSMQIIEEEMGSHSLSPEDFRIVQRVIHTSADFELGRSMKIHSDAVKKGIAALVKGAPVICDVQMIEAGINKPRLKKWGNEVHVFISDDDVIVNARERGVTRAIMSMQKAARLYPEGGIFVVGNAPTALFEVLRLIRDGQLRPDLVIGVPVGFVSAKESKDALISCDCVPYISNEGRKGGSPVAVSCVNALSLMAEQKYER